jgi:hypothetical protein
MTLRLDGSNRFPEPNLRHPWELCRNRYRYFAQKGRSLGPGRFPEPMGTGSPASGNRGGGFQ